VELRDWPRSSPPETLWGFVEGQLRAYGTMRKQLYLCLILLAPGFVTPLQCLIGYGQRGLNYENGIGWTRECHHPSAYCFEAVTYDINKMLKLFNYPWDSYYDFFYVRACGGDYGTNYTWHPYKPLPKKTRYILGNVLVNITTPKLITGEGGPENRVEMMLGYKCKTDLCAKRRGSIKKQASYAGYTASSAQASAASVGYNAGYSQKQSNASTLSFVLTLMTILLTAFFTR
jgi:hypothetical protein